MMLNLVRTAYNIAAIYFYFTEEHTVKAEKDVATGDCITTLTAVSSLLKEIKEASLIVEEIDSWKEKLEKKYSVGEKLDKGDGGELSKASLKWYRKVRSIAQELDKEQKTLELLGERIKRVEKGFEPILENIKDYMSSFQSATMALVESSPTERSLEPRLRGLLNSANSGELVLTGYFDQYLLKTFKVMSPKPPIKFISPELTNSKQDKINLDALERLSKMGAKVRFHPMLHARLVLSPTEIIVGSADIKSDCLGGRRYDVAVWANNPVLVESGKVFIDKVWNESKPL